MTYVLSAVSITFWWQEDRMPGSMTSRWCIYYYHYGMVSFQTYASNYQYYYPNTKAYDSLPWKKWRERIKYMYPIHNWSIALLTSYFIMSVVINDHGNVIWDGVKKFWQLRIFHTLHKLKISLYLQFTIKFEAIL